jgi:molybdopterin converting factor small subunit
MPKIILPELLKKYTPDTLEYRVSGATVYECLRELVAQCPSLEAKLFKEDGKLSATFIIYLDNRDIRMLEGADTQVEPDSTIRLLAALAGG